MSVKEAMWFHFLDHVFYLPRVITWPGHFHKGVFPRGRGERGDHQLLTKLGATNLPGNSYTLGVHQNLLSLRITL